MKKVFLLACGLSGVFGCVGLGNVAHAETISAAPVAPTSQVIPTSQEVLLLPESDREPLLPVEVTQPEVVLVPTATKVEVATTKADAVTVETVNIASKQAMVPAPTVPKFVRIPMHSRIFPALFQ